LEQTDFLFNLGKKDAINAIKHGDADPEEIFIDPERKLRNGNTMFKKHYGK
jgi:hypothetical protein